MKAHQQNDDSAQVPINRYFQPYQKLSFSSIRYVTIEFQFPDRITQNSDIKLRILSCLEKKKNWC
jgi:hypothetical protein